MASPFYAPLALRYCATYHGVRCAMYSAIFIAIVLFGLTILVVRARRERRRLQETIESYVASIFSAQSYRPDVSAGFTYGIPSFSLKFKTDKDKKHAISSGLTEQFVRSIQELYGHLRPRGEAFDADRAVSIYSAEDEKCWSQEGAACRNKEGR